MEDLTTLQVVWFVLISVLWLGYFVLEGFDFGVGILLRAVGKTPAERRAVIHSIGPVWDGNEVWLLVAGGATFAAFPDWYATLFSGFYLALFLILVGLIVRNVAFELWGKSDSPAWRSRWEWTLIVGSFIPALLWGVGWANIVHGVPIDQSGEYTGNLFTLLNPYALLGGVTSLTLFMAHGANFLTLRTTGVMLERAKDLAGKLTSLSWLVTTGFVAWTIIDSNNHRWLVAACGIGAVLALAGSTFFSNRAAGKAFVASTLATVLLFCALFIDLFPNAMVSSTDSAFDLTLAASSSSPYTLKVMTVVAVLLVPVVLLYQGWTYWVFRHRVSAEDFGDIRSPIDLIAQKTHKAADHSNGTPSPES